MQSKIDSGSEMLLSNISTRNRNLQLNVYPIDDEIVADRMATISFFL